MARVDVVVNDAALVRVLQEVEQLFGDAQQFEQRLRLARRALVVHFFRERVSRCSLKHEVEVARAAYGEIIAAQQEGKGGMTGQMAQGSPFSEQIGLLTSADGRRIARHRALDDDRALAIRHIVGLDGLAGAATREDVLAAIAFFEEVSQARVFLFCRWPL